MDANPVHRGIDGHVHLAVHEGSMSITDIFRGKRRQARHFSEGLIRQGLVPLSDIPFQVSLLVEEEMEEGEVEPIVKKAWQKLQAQSTATTGSTPIDRLDRAFKALEAKGIMARHYPQDGRSEAYSSIMGEIASAKKEGQEFHSYCFYDQHSASEMWDGALSFSFGAAEAAPTYARLWPAQIRVGEAVCEILAAERFDVSWSHSPGDVITVSGVDWRGPRNEDGSPAVQTGTRFDASARGKHKENAPVVRSVFVAAATELAIAHDFVAAVAEAKSGGSYGTPSNADNDCSAADYTSSDDVIFDLVAAPTGTRGLFTGRDLVRECELLIELTPSVEEAQNTWWDSFSPEARLLVVTQSVSDGEHDGSAVLELNLNSRQGLDEVMAALEKLGPPPPQTET